MYSSVFKPPVTQVAVRSKTVVLLLLIHCLNFLQLVCVRSVFVACFVTHLSVLPSFAMKRASCFTFIVFLMSCNR